MLFTHHTQKYTKVEWCQSGGQVRCAPLFHTLWTTTIMRHSSTDKNAFLGFGEPGGDCETSVHFKTEESHSEKEGLPPRWLTREVKSQWLSQKQFYTLMDLATAPFVLVLSLAPQAKGLGRSYPTHGMLGNRHSELGSNYRPWSDPWISFSPSQPQSGSPWRWGCQI